MDGLAQIRMQISDEESRRKMWQRENIRRRHNYLPFIMELLKGLAAEGQLAPIYERAKEKALDREKRKKEGKL